MELTAQDIDVLLESVEAWENKDSSDRLMGSMLGAMLTKGDEKSRAEFKAQQEEEARAAKQSQRLRKERSVVLRAKLIAIRDSMAADRILDESHAG